MGQAATKERHSHDEGQRQPSYPSSVDGGALEPQGVYTGPQDYSHDVVRSAIVQKKLMPFYKGMDDEDAYQDKPFNTECPICFLYYPSPLNHTRCCSQPICTECFVQIKRADPNHTNPPSSQPAECPFCTAENFGIVYTRPPVSPTAQTSESAASSSQPSEPTHRKRKSFSHTDPDVLTTDMVRPDWAEKLASAQAAILRRANRRIIMRQVGERLIPIGISSSRAGAELPEGTGPGGAIILREGERWGPFSGDGVFPGRRGGSRRGGSNDVVQMGGQDVEEMMLMEAMRLSLIEHEEQQRRLAQQQQNSEAQTSSGSAGDRTTAETQAPTSAPAPNPAQAAEQQGLHRSSSTSRGQPMAPRSRRADRLSQDIRNATPASEYMSSISTGSQQQPQPGTASQVQGSARVPAAGSGSSTTSDQPPTLSLAPSGPINFGLRDDMMTELAELIDEPNEEMRRRIEAAKKARQDVEEVQRQAEHARVRDPPASTTSVHQAVRSSPGPTSQSTLASVNQSSPATAAATPPGSQGSRRPNPNNPFRSRLASSGNASPAYPNQGSGTTTPSHSRTASTSELGLAFGTGAVGAAPAAPFAVPEEPWTPAAPSQQVDSQQHSYPHEAQH